MNETILLSKHQVVRATWCSFLMYRPSAPRNRNLYTFRAPCAYLTFPEDFPQ